MENSALSHDSYANPDLRFPKPRLPFHCSPLLTLQTDKIHLYYEGDPKPHFSAQMAAGRWASWSWGATSLQPPSSLAPALSHLHHHKSRVSHEPPENSFPNLLKVYFASCYRYRWVCSHTPTYRHTLPYPPNIHTHTGAHVHTCIWPYACSLANSHCTLTHTGTLSCTHIPHLDRHIHSHTHAYSHAHSHLDTHLHRHLTHYRHTHSHTCPVCVLSLGIPLALDLILLQLG